MIQSITNHNPAADSRPTVCHVIHALGVGGAEVLVDRMVRRMSDEFRCVIAVLDEIGEIGQRLQQGDRRTEGSDKRGALGAAAQMMLEIGADVGRKTIVEVVGKQRDDAAAGGTHATRNYKVKTRK